MPLNQILPLLKERKVEFQSHHPATLKIQHGNHTRWKPPDRDFCKVNYDGAVFSEQGRAGIGVVIRNSDGAVMASLSQQVHLPTIVAQTEALAARRAMEFALEIGLTKVIIEGDLDIVHKDLNNANSSLALHGHLIQDVKTFIPYFSNISFNHVCRKGNNVAHELVRRAIRLSNLTI